MKLSKNLVTIVSNLWTSCSIKKFLREHSHCCDVFVSFSIFLRDVVLENIRTKGQKLKFDRK